MTLPAVHPYGHEEPLEISRTEFESFVRDGFYFEEDMLEKLLLNEVVEGVKGPKQVRARFVVGQFANSLDANFYNPTPGLEVTRVLLAMALSENLTILFGDLRVAFMNTPMPDGDPVYVEPPEGFFEHNDTVWCLKRALSGMRDASRLFHEHFVAELTSRLGFTRSEAQPTLFVDLARNVFIAVHVDDLIMVGSSSQLSEVVGEMKQYFTMNSSALSQFHPDVRGCTVSATR